MGELWLGAALLTVLSGIPVARQLRHHPPGLWLLFFTEMWERFSYYGMRSLLIFYLTEHFLLDDHSAQGRYSAYTALNYLLPLAGGVVGDRILGARRAVAFGALLLVAGHCTMALESTPAHEIIAYQGRHYQVESSGQGEERRETILVEGRHVAFTRSKNGALLLAHAPGLPDIIPARAYTSHITPVSGRSQMLFNLALALIVVGVGFQKANMTALVGGLYANRPDRDQGFTLYMFGINIGAFWSSVACGWLGMTVGWWAGFGAAGLGMAAGYLAFIRFQGVLGPIGVAPARTSQPAKTLAYLGAIPAVALVMWLVQDFALTGALLSVSTLCILGYLVWISRNRYSVAQRTSLFIALALIVLGLLWTSLAEQQGAALSLFADRNTSLRVGPVHVDATQVQAFYMGFLLILVPILAWLWDRLARRGRDPAPTSKFVIAFALQALSFLILGLSGSLARGDGRVPLIVVVLALLVHAASEMTFGPIILAEVTRRAPPGLSSTLAATWYLAVSWGQWLGGLLTRTAAAADHLSSRDSLPIYLFLFLGTSVGAAGGGLLASIMAYVLRRPSAVPDGSVIASP